MIKTTLKKLSDGRTGYRRRHRVVVEADGQTEFTLPSSPVDSEVMAQVNTVLYHPPHLRLDGDLAVWADKDFKLDPEDEVAFYYYEERPNG